MGVAQVKVIPQGDMRVMLQATVLDGQEVAGACKGAASEGL